MPDLPEHNIDATDNTNKVQQVPSQTSLASVKGNENDKSRNDKFNGETLEGSARNSKHWTTYVEAFCTVVLVFITGFYTYYAHRQAGAAITAANAAKSAADTAASQLILTRKTLAATSGAICGPVVNSRNNLPYMYFLVACATGKVDATLLNANFEVAVKNLRTGRVSSKSKKFTVVPQLIRGGATRQVDFDILGFSETNYLSLRQDVIVQGSIAYDDGFDRKISDPFCIELLPFRNSNGIYNGMVQYTCGGAAEDALRKYAAADQEQKLGFR